MTVAGVILAGGRGRRLGGPAGTDKALVKLAGRPLVAWVATAAAAQTTRLWLSANGDPQRFASFGLPVMADDFREPDGGCAGPLAGLLRALDHLAEAAPELGCLASFPCDTPRFPTNLVATLTAARAACPAPCVYAILGSQPQPLLALWSAAQRGQLRDFLAAGGRRVRDWQATAGAHAVRFDFDEGININRPEELVAAQAVLAGGETSAAVKREV